MNKYSQSKPLKIFLSGPRQSLNSHLRITLMEALEILSTWSSQIYVDCDTAPGLDIPAEYVLPLSSIDPSWDLIVVVGGDGSLLKIAPTAAEHNVPMVGINRGHLGFLTDILPTQLKHDLSQILQNKCNREQRFLLTMQTQTEKAMALNDVVLVPDSNHPGMIEFTLYVDAELVCQQRADGVIIATPTGSTAYTLSGGGPILHPKLDAIVLVPMFPHTLSSRPIVVSGHSTIQLTLDPCNASPCQLRCDGQLVGTINPGETLTVCKKDKLLTLIHPLGYNYYETLRSKLGWQTKHRNNTC